jgi:N4-gp56 family major capsid protein
VEQFFGGLMAGHVAVYHPSNARGAKGLVPGFTLAPHAFTGGNQAGGTDQASPGIQSIIPSNEGTLGAGVPGVVFTDAARVAAYGLNADFAKVVTALVVRNTLDTLRTKAVFAQEGNMYLRAKHVEGTNQFVYTGFADLGAAVELLEGIPPETEKMLFDTFAFGGKQVGKTTAITDLAEIFSPFDLYAKASEKLAWNAVDYVETTLGTLINTAPALTITETGYAQGIVGAVTRLKRRNVPTFPDGTYHGFITPETAAKVTTQVGELGWTDTSKYAQPDAILNGELGKFRGVRWIEANRLNSGATDEVVIFGPEAYIAGDFQTIQAYRVGAGGDHADPLGQRAIMGWKGMMGYALVAFDGSPAMGPASNIQGYRAYRVTLAP